LKIAIIGAGHNGLVCGAYLAKSGFDVTIFEKRSQVGGLCVTEELFAGYKVSSVASYYGMLREEIAQELELTKYGLKPYLTDPIEIILLPNGKYVFTPREGGQAKTEVGNLSLEEKQGWQRFWADMGKAAQLIYPLYFVPSTTQADIVNLLDTNKLNNIARYIFRGSLFELLQEYISNQYLMAAAATCTPGFANKRGSVFGCIHHGTAKTKGEFGAWGFVKGGMGEITQSLSKSAQANEVKILTNKAIKAIKTTEAVNEIIFEDNTSTSFDYVVSNTDPFTLFQKLLPADSVSETILQEIEANKPLLSAGKIHFALNALPAFPLLTELKHNYSGVIVIAPSMQSVINDSDKVPFGNMPESLMLTMGFPSVADPTTAPNGKHLLTVDIHYLPSKINNRAWTKEDNEQLLKNTINRISEHSSNFTQCIEDTAVVSPYDLEKTYNLSGGSCWHMPMNVDNLFERRKFPGCEGYKTLFNNLYQCGASTYPGGNVTGANGRNCAHEIIKAANVATNKKVLVKG
jgi:phytoene dehydrogenase-like protein